MTLKNRVKLLIDILEKSKITKLEVSSFWGFRKIKLLQENSTSQIKKDEPQSNRASEGVKDVLGDTSRSLDKKESTVENEEEVKKTTDFDHIKAPLVGTVYLSSKPDDPAFVKEGDIVKKGQVICIIEAMKIFNDIEADKNGIIQKILVNNEDPVEFGQELFEINSSN
tara:strand:- start:76 stop:579 length:504 start_codon:yes stop_codon:yes gene_type:complete